VRNVARTCTRSRVLVSGRVGQAVTAQPAGRLV